MTYKLGIILKAFKTGCFIFSLMISTWGFSLNPKQLSPEILEIVNRVEQTQQILISNQVKHRVLIQISNQLSQDDKLIQNCIRTKQDSLNIVLHENNLIKEPGMNNYLMAQKNQSSDLAQAYQEQLNLCQLLDYKISGLKKQIEKYNQINYLKSFSLKHINFFSNLKQVHFNEVVLPPKGYVSKTFLTQSNVARYSRWLLIILMSIVLFKVMQNFEWISKSYLHNLKLKRFAYIAVIFIFISPVQYLILKISYSHHDDILINLYKKPSHFLMTMAILYYLYQYLDSKYFKYDIAMIVFTFFGEASLISFCETLQYFDLNNISDSQTLMCKYLILITLQAVLIYLFYWLFIRILSFNRKQLGYFSVFFVGSIILFMFGLSGFVDLAINIDFTIIFFSIIFVWLLIFYRVKNSILHFVRHPSPRIKKFLEDIFSVDEQKAMTNLVLLIQFIFFNILFQVIAVSFVAFTWFFSKDIVNQSYEFFYQAQTLGSFSFTVVNYVYAIVAFLSLNIFNYAFSNLCAGKIFEEPVARHKIAQFFYILGLFVIGSISLMITKINLQNLILLFGGLFIGIGLGLKNILSNLISSLILFTNRPFEINDFVSIGSTKGFVKKVGILETKIETVDHDVVILPNQLIASSPIENFTYGEKNLHQIHFKYFLLAMTAQQEKIINESIKDIFKKSKYVETDTAQEPQFIFSPDAQNLGGYDLEVIFNVNTLHHLKSIISEINREIIDRLMKKGIELKFNQQSHPLM
jgi:small-conductance mechanosensitive channel